jgi:DNA replication protein DnaC
MNDTSIESESKYDRQMDIIQSLIVARKNFIIYGLPSIGKTFRIIGLIQKANIRLNRINCIYYNTPHLLITKISEIFQQTIKDPHFKPVHKVIFSGLLSYLLA